jgi:RNA-directed DNA polymerase
MSGDVHVRFREHLRGRFPRVTRLVILVDAHRRHDWLIKAVEKRLREEFAKLQVEINEEKNSIVDLSRGESFGFLGFDFRRTRSLRGVWRPHYAPKLKKRTVLLQELKEVFRRHQSQPVDRVVDLINPILRGWVNYFAVGYSSQCFNYIQDWVEKKIRRHLTRSRKRRGFGAGSGGVDNGFMTVWGCFMAIGCHEHGRKQRQQDRSHKL